MVSVFKRNRSCIDQLYSLHRIIHNCIKFNVLLYMNVIDFKAAFDSINCDLIRKAFERYGLPKNTSMFSKRSLEQLKVQFASMEN